MKELAETLHNLEKKVLLILKEFPKGITNNMIEEKADLKEAEVNKAVEGLKEKNIIQVKESMKELFKTSETGVKYIDSELPEAKFLKTASNGPISFDKIKEQADLDKNEFNVSIGLLKKIRAIEIINREASITDKGKDYLKQLEKQKEFIVLLKDKKYLDEVPKELSQFVIEFEKRGLVERHIEKIKTISLTDKGEKIIPHVKIEDQIELVTKEVILNKTWKNKPFRKYNITTSPPVIHSGKKQPYLQFLDETRQMLVGLGFEEMEGPMVEFSFFNNESLFMPQDHPAREIHDVFHLKNPKYGDLTKYNERLEKVKEIHEKGGDTGSKGWGYKFDTEKASELLLRSQTTAVSSRTLTSSNLKIPGKYFSIDRNFRVDTIDWKHLIEFNQLEGIVLGNEINFKELLGLLKALTKDIIGADKFKFTPGYFPFTEPSVEMHVWLKDRGWVELGGAGIFRPEVTKAAGIDVPVIAWGLGIARIFMLKHGIKDIRDLYSTDLRWLRKFKW